MSTRHPLPRKTIVLFDGGCPLCVRTWRQLKSQDRQEQLALVDITHPQFDAAAWGFCRGDLLRTLHVRDDAGRWRTGIDGIAHVQRRLGHAWVASLLAAPLLRPLLAPLYGWLARHRYALPCGAAACIRPPA